MFKLSAVIIFSKLCCHGLALFYFGFQVVQKVVYMNVLKNNHHHLRKIFFLEANGILFVNPVMDHREEMAPCFCEVVKSRHLRDDDDCYNSVS